MKQYLAIDEDENVMTATGVYELYAKLLEQGWYRLEEVRDYMADDDDCLQAELELERAIEERKDLAEITFLREEKDEIMCDKIDNFDDEDAKRFFSNWYIELKIKEVVNA